MNTTQFEHNSLDKQTSEMLFRIAELVSFQSYTKDITQNTGIQKYIEERFQKAQLRPLKGHDSVVFDNEGYRSFVGVKGTGVGPCIGLLFHYDVVPDVSEWHSADKHLPVLKTKEEFLPYMRPVEAALADDLLLVGKGVADMIGAVEAILTAAELIADDIDGTCMIIATPDEETDSAHGMEYILKMLAEEDSLPHVLVGAESTFMDVLVRRRAHGTYSITLESSQEDVHQYHYQVTTSGKNMHSGSFTWNERHHHAFWNMSQALQKIGDHQLLDIQGGIKSNVIPKECMASIATSEPLELTVLDEMDAVTIKQIDPSEQLMTQTVLHGFHQLVEALTHFQPTVVAESQYGASVMPNVIHGALCEIDIRAMIGDVGAFEKELLEHFVAYGVQPKIEKGFCSKPFFSDNTDPALRIAIDVLNTHGWEPTGNRENYGGSDMSFTYPYPIVGYEIGPVGANEHAADEWLCVKSVAALPEIYAKIVERSCAELEYGRRK